MVIHKKITIYDFSKNLNMSRMLVDWGLRGSPSATPYTSSTGSILVNFKDFRQICLKVGEKKGRECCSHYEFFFFNSF